MTENKPTSVRLGYGRSSFAHFFFITTILIRIWFLTIEFSHVLFVGLSSKLFYIKLVFVVISPLSLVVVLYHVQYCGQSRVFSEYLECLSNFVISLFS